MRAHDLTGQSFDRLTAMAPVVRHGRRRAWKCRCACGREAVVDTNKLRSGHSRSCGCLLADKNRELRQTHGHASQSNRSLTYRSYTNMITRCENPKAINYPRYGGKGVSICDRWRNGDGRFSGFECFLHDVGERPSVRHSIDRVRSWGHYEPGNCRWVLPLVQGQNSSLNRMLDVDGQKLCMTEAARQHGLSAGTVWSRLKNGWTPSAALKTPVQASAPRQRQFSEAAQ